MADIEFFDLTNASEEEVKEIKTILEQTSSNGCVELPWETPLASAVEDATGNEGENVKTDEPTAGGSSVGVIVGQALLYAPPLPPHVPAQPGPAAPLSAQNHDVMTPIEAFIPPPLSAASALGPPYATPYLVSRTVPYLRAYPHMGMPLFTCALPGSGELTHVPSPYTPFMPVAAPSAVPPPPLDKNIGGKEENDVRQKTRGPIDRQFNRRNKKKLPSSGNFYNPSDIGQSPEAYQESMAPEDQTLAPMNTGNDSLSSVPSSLPVVPVPVPPSTFAVTSGAIPLHGYPPGLHPLPYSQISGPQAPTTPVYYVPVFNHPPYSSYIPSPASGHMMLPVGIPGGIPAANESTSTTASDGSPVTKSSESLHVSSDSTGKHSNSSMNIESDNEAPASQSRCDDLNKEIDPASTVIISEKNDVVDCCSQEHSGSLTDVVTLSSPNTSICQEERIDGDKLLGRWADLFKKQCPEVNGFDRRPVGITNTHTRVESDMNKEITNGKLYTVPNNDVL